MNEHYISRAYRKGWLVIGLVLIAILSIVVFKNNQNTSAFLVGLPLLIAGIMAFFGTLQVIQGRKGKKNFKFFFALIVNMGMTILLISLIIANLNDLAKVLN